MCVVKNLPKKIIIAWKNLIVIRYVVSLLINCIG